MHNRFHDCKEEIQKANLRATPARVATLQLFESEDTPLDAHAAIVHLQKELGIDRVTVFRILNTFVANKLLRKVEFGEGKSRYELANAQDHHHLICDRCRKVIDFADRTIPHLQQRLQREYKFAITSHALEFFGVCMNCQK